MQHPAIVGPPLAWSRDFAVVGVALGGLAPYFLLFDVSMALCGGLVGGLLGAALGGVSGWAVEQLRGVVPLSVMLASMAALGGLWGGAAGTLGAASGTVFGEPGMLFGLALGGCSGMVAIGLWFPAYLFLSVRRDPTWPAVLGAVLCAPIAGWLGLAALIVSTFGGWLFLLPLAMWAGSALDRSMARALETRPQPLLAA